MKKIKKIVCSMTALALLVCMFGCERKEKEKTVIKQEVDIQKADDESSIADEFKGVYKYQTLDFTDDVASQINVIGKSAAGYWVSYKINDGNGNVVDIKVSKVGIENGSEICKAKLDEVPEELKKNVSPYNTSFAIADDGGFIQLICIEESTVGTDRNKVNFTTNEGDEYYSHVISHYYAVRFDNEGNYVSNQPIYSSEEGDRYCYFDICPMENGSFMIADKTSDNPFYMMYDGKKTVSKLNKLKKTDNFLKIIVPQDDKTAIAFYNTSDCKEKWFTFDIESGKTGEEKSVDSLNTGGYLFNEIKGIDGKYYAYDENGIYSLDLENSKKQLIVNYTNSSIDGTKITTVFPLENGDFLAVMTDENWENERLIRLKQADPKSLENIQTITVAVGQDDDILSQIAEYNASQDKYKIVAKNYAGYNGNSDEAYKQLNTDIAAGNAPDIISFDLINKNVYSFAKKGMFVDLYTMFQQDESIKPEDYYSGILKACEYDGKLMGICSCFMVNFWACDEQGEVAKNFSDGWTTDEFIDFYNNIPEGKAFFETGSADRTGLKSSLILSNLDNFIDLRNSSCSFNTPEFIKLLEFMKTLPNDQIAIDTGEDTTNWTDEDYLKEFENNNTSNSDFNDKSYKQIMAMRNGNAFVREEHMANMSDYWREKNTYFPNGMKFIGFPTIGSTRPTTVYTYNKYGILSSSKYPEQCWEFLKIIMNSQTYGYSVSRSTFEKNLRYETEVSSYTDENGNVKVYPNTIQVGDKEEDIGYPTWEDLKPFRDFIDTLEAYSDYSEEIYNIINEECQSFYNDKQDSKKTAKNIQDRILIYLSEHE